jgi:hypothetical protein
MVDLPSIPLATPQVRAPQSPVSPGDIAAPYAALAKTLDVMGEQIQENIAKPFAEEAGRQAVRTGADGQLIVDKAPIFGPASAEFSRAARFTYLAQVQPKIENKMTELRLAHPNDPEAFQNAAGEYVKTITGNVQDPALRGSVEKMAAETASHNYRTTLVNTDATNRENALISLKSRLEAINERGGSLARQGGVETPEYQQLHADRAAIYNELASDPRFKFPKERVDQELKANRDEDVVEAVVGNVVRQYQTKKNAPDAQRALQDAFWGDGSEKLSLSVTQRNKGVTEGLRALERVGVEDRVATSAFQSAAGEYVKDLQKAPNNFVEGRHNDMEARARELGDYKSLTQLQVAKTFVPLWSAIKALPPDQAAPVMADIARNVVPALPVRLPDRGVQSKIESEAVRLGVPPQLAVAVAAIESRGNANAVSPSGLHRGIFQLSDDEFAGGGGQGSPFDADQNIKAGLASLRAKSEAFAKDFGRSPTATEVYLMHQQGEAGARAHLANPDQPAWVNMLGTGEGKRKGEAWAKAAVWGNLPPSAQQQFGSVENVSSRDFVGVWTQRVQGIPYEGTGLTAGASGTALRNPYVYKMWEDTVKSTREQLGKNAEHLATQIETQARDGNPVPDDTLRTFVASVISSGKDELLTRVRPALAASDARAQVRTEGPGALAALDSHITALKASGVDPVQYETLKTLQAGVEKDAQTWRKDPISIGVATKVIDPVHQIATNDPGQASAELAQRDGKLKVLQGSGRGVGPSSVLTEGEGDGFKTALVQGDAQTAGALLTGMAQSLSPETLKATMASDPMKEALSGMIRARDPARMTAGMSMLDKLWNMDPWGFRAIYGGATTDHLQAWQGLKDSFTAPEIAERLNKADDPGVAKARTELAETAKKELTGWFGQDAGHVAYELGTAWSATNWIPGSGLVQRNITGATGQVPFDPVKQHELMNDFNSTYTALRTYGVDPDKAKELAAKRLKSEWGVSPTAGNQLMKYPPEAYYKPVDGSHSWLFTDLHDAVSAVKGPQVTMYNEGTEFATGRSNWTIKGLVADSQTQTEIAAGKPPSYLVALDTGKGMTEFLSDPKSGQRRWAFDRAAHVAASEKRFTEKNAFIRTAVDPFSGASNMP